MPKPKRDDPDDPKDLGIPAIEETQDLGTMLPGEPIDTDDNDAPYADANGDSDDERPDENEAVPDGA
jgi:hypothetical protein